MESVPPGFVLLNSATQASAKRSEFQAQISFKWRDWAPAICFLLVTPVPSSWNGQGGLAELPPPRVVCWGCKNANRKKRKKSNVFKQVLLSFFFFYKWRTFPLQTTRKGLCQSWFVWRQSHPHVLICYKALFFLFLPHPALKIFIGKENLGMKERKISPLPWGCLSAIPAYRAGIHQIFL